LPFAVIEAGIHTHHEIEHRQKAYPLVSVSPPMNNAAQWKQQWDNKQYQWHNPRNVCWWCKPGKPAEQDHQ